jgi:hypothetical protein
MSLKKTIVRINVKIDTDILLESSLKLTFQTVDKLCYPTVLFIIFLAVGNEDVVVVSFDYTRHQIIK